MIISVDAQNTFDKIKHLFMIKNSPESGHRGNKGHIWQPTARVTHSGEKLKAFPLRSGTRQGCSLSPLAFNIVLKILAIAIWEEKNKRIQIGKVLL